MEAKEQENFMPLDESSEQGSGNKEILFFKSQAKLINRYWMAKRRDFVMNGGTVTQYNEGQRQKDYEEALAIYPDKGMYTMVDGEFIHMSKAVKV